MTEGRSPAQQALGICRTLQIHSSQQSPAKKAPNSSPEGPGILCLLIRHQAVALQRQGMREAEVGWCAAADTCTPSLSSHCGTAQHMLVAHLSTISTVPAITTRPQPLAFSRSSCSVMEPQSPLLGRAMASLVLPVTVLPISEASTMSLGRLAPPAVTSRSPVEEGEERKRRGEGFGEGGRGREMHATI